MDGKANAKAIDDKTLEVTLNYPVPFMMEVFAMSAMTVVRTDKYEETGDAYYQSVPEAMNGPFLLAEWKPNDVMVLEPNPDYWDAEAVNFDRVEIYTVKDDTTQVNMYENGEIDLLTIPDTMYKDFEDKGIIYYEDGLELLHSVHHRRPDRRDGEVPRQPQLHRGGLRLHRPRGLRGFRLRRRI